MELAQYKALTDFAQKIGITTVLELEVVLLIANSLAVLEMNQKNVY